MLGVNCRRPDDDFECKCSTLADGALCDICGSDDDVESVPRVASVAEADQAVDAAEAVEAVEAAAESADEGAHFVPNGSDDHATKPADYVLVGESPFTPMRGDVVEWLAELGLELRGFGNDDEGCTIIHVHGTAKRIFDLFREGIVGALAHSAVPGLVQGFRPGINLPGLGIVYPMDPSTY